MNSPIATEGSIVTLVNDIGIECLAPIIKKGVLKKGNNYTVKGVLLQREGFVFYELEEIEFNDARMGVESSRFKVFEMSDIKNFKR